MLKSKGLDLAEFCLRYLKNKAKYQMLLLYSRSFRYIFIRYIRYGGLAIDLAWSVDCLCVFVCLLVTAMSPTKTDKAVEMPFGFWTWAGPRNHMLGGGHISPEERAILGVVLPHENAL